MPLDPEPVKGGNIELLSAFFDRPVARVHAKALEMGYRAHFVSCPNAAQHRKRGTGK
jgi:hypothetical protein